MISVERLFVDEARCLGKFSRRGNCRFLRFSPTSGFLQARLSLNVRLNHEIDPVLNTLPRFKDSDFKVVKYSIKPKCV
jgi:hypothetical protein